MMDHKMMLEKLSGKERTGLFIAVVFVFLVILDRAILAPINDRIGQINREIKIGEKQLAMGLRNVSQKELVAGERKNYAQYLKNTGSDEEKTAAMLSEIENLAKKTGVSLVDMKPRPAQNVDFYIQYSIDVEAEGTMDALESFLYQLNASTQLLRAQKLRLNLKDKDASIVKASVQITKLSI